MNDAQTMTVHGGCHCGAIAYRAVVDPAHVTICHCTDCQNLSGSAYRVSVPAPVDDFALLRGVLATYVKRGSSGAGRVQGFCGRCGSPIWSSAEHEPSTYALRVGCIDERAALPARAQIWCRSALAWTTSIDALPAKQEE